MNEVTMALGYVIYVLHKFWRQGVDRPIEVGTVLEVSRSERNNLVSGQVARDATEAEIAEFRGEPPLIQCAVRSCNFGALIPHDIGQRQHARTANAAKEIGFVFCHPSPLLRAEGICNCPSPKYGVGRG